MNVLDLLAHHGIAYEQKESDNVYIECPDCGKMNLSISVFSGIWHCWNSDCEEKGSRGSLPLLAEKLNINITGVQLEPAPPPKDKTLSAEDIKAILSTRQNKPEVIEWASSRGLDPSFVIEQGVGYDKHVKAIVFPFRDPKSGEVVGAKYRGTDRPDQWVKGVVPELYVLDRQDLAKEKVVIVEGEVDALTLKMLKIPVVAVLGASKTKGLRLLASQRQVYLGYDMDEAGETGAAKAIQEIGRYRCKRVTWRLKDPNDMLMAGQREEILQCIKEARSLATDTKSLNASVALDTYLASLEKAQRKRLSWGYPRLDSLTNGLGGGEYIGVLAEAGTGKTTFIINVARNLAHAGVKCGIASLEEHNINEITPKLSATIVGRNPGVGGFSPEEIKAVKAEQQRVEFYPGSEDPEELCDWIRECYYVHDCKVIFIDYFQLIVADETNVQLVKQTSYTFKKLVKELPELCIVMVIQPKQEQRARAKDGSEAKSLKLDGRSARGGASINQSVDKMLTIKGVDGHPNLTQFEYTKVRGHLNVSKRDWLNKFTQLEYDPNTLRQVEVAHLVYGGG